MANPHVPTNLRVKRLETGNTIIEWDFPVPGIQNRYTYNVYLSTTLTDTTPLAGPAVLTDIPRLEAELEGVITDAVVTVSSVNTTTTEESSQSTELVLQLANAASDGLSEVLVARDPAGVTRFLNVDDDGNLAVTSGGGAATEAKQDEIITNTSGRDLQVYGPTSSGVVSNTATGNVDISVTPDASLLLRIEVRPDVASNNFDLELFSDAGRTKKILEITGITDDEFVAAVDVAYVGTTLYFSVTNNAGADRNFTIEGVLEAAR